MIGAPGIRLTFVVDHVEHGRYGGSAVDGPIQRIDGDRWGTISFWHDEETNVRCERLKNRARYRFHRFHQRDQPIRMRTATLVNDRQCVFHAAQSRTPVGKIAVSCCIHVAWRIRQRPATIDNARNFRQCLMMKKSPVLQGLFRFFF
jgi:hypothetical protein